MKGYSYENLCSGIENLCKKYNFVKSGNIGRSLVGRELPFLSIGEGNKSILYVGTHHGMEWMTSMLLMKYAEEYCEAVKSRSAVGGSYADVIFGARRIFIVPMLNPDGAELQIYQKDEKNPLTERLSAMSGGDYSKWQANGRGVDLNHNYNAGFDIYKRMEAELGITGGCATRYSGEYPESEPETSALCAFIRATDISMLAALHTQGGEIYYDYNGKAPTGARAIAERMSRLSGYRVSKPEGAASYGGLKDWFIEEFNRPGFTVECGYGENPLSLMVFSQVYHQVRKMLMEFPIMG